MNADYYPPLTEAEFNDGTFDTYNGVPLVENEDGDCVFAYGHIDKDKFAEAVNAHDRDLGCGDPDEPYDPVDVLHVQAVTRRPAGGPDGWYISWYPPIVEASDQPTFSLTVVAR